MRKFLAIFLAALMLLGILTGCQNKEGAEQTTTEETTTGPTQPKEEQEVLRILTIGNSHTVDANLLFRNVFKAEAPDQKVMLGNMYFSGCAVSQHVKHFENNEPVYVYYRNVNGAWEQKPQMTLEYALQEQAWDIIILHEMNSGVGLENTYQNDNYQKLIDYIKEKTVYAPKFIYNLSWANPTSQKLWDLGYPGDWVGGYDKSYGKDYVNMFTKMTEMVQKYVVTNSSISGVIPTGTAFCYARNEKGQSDDVLYRDYTHVSDFGSLLAAYTWFAVVMGKTEITDVNIDVVPARQRHEKFWNDGDLIVTQEMKDIIVESVNFALKNPFQVTPVK